LLLILLLSPTLVLAQAPASSQPPRIVGNWKLNPEKSGVQVPPDYVEVRQYQLRPDGYMVGLLIQGNSRGLRYLQFTAKSDGNDYPEFSDQIVADMIATGRQTPRTYAERILDDDVIEWIDKAEGRVTARGRKTVSKDGRTLTITVDGQPESQARIYDRQ